MVNSFYDPELEQGCAFEELISFHGGLGGPQTQPFILHPVALAMPDAPVVGAEAVHELLMRWRFSLQRPRALAAPAVRWHGAATFSMRSSRVSDSYQRALFAACEDLVPGSPEHWSRRGTSTQRQLTRE